ncbi:MAG: 3-hydroxyacyl-CoA dehydrogenase [Bacteroidetes bacterium]|nr:3-hydroxyacyl-CoA dehydrogenase [Bacteroidota bacterium]
MEIVVVGSESNLKECQLKFGPTHGYHHYEEHVQAQERMKTGGIVFDFKPGAISGYDREDQVIFLNSTNATLAQILSGKSCKAAVFGFCGLPSFLNREILEITLLKKEDQPQLEKICTQLNTHFKIAEDRVGMITPRIVCMIINEAYFAIEEGVASRADIDLAMKLGTNYPFGPFEWCKKIGIKNVYKLLTAVYNDTKDERYKICELLKKEATSTNSV